MKSPFSHQFKWISLFRISAVSVIGGIGIYYLREQKHLLFPLSLIIGFTYFLTLIYGLFFRKEKTIPFIIWASVVLDTFIVAAMVHFTGGIESDLSLLYFFPIISASIFFGFLKGGAIVGTFCVLNYGSLLFLEFRKIITPVFPALVYDINAVYLKFYLNASFFYLVSATAGYLGERFKQRGEALEQIRLDTDTILHNINSGIVVLDYDGEILYKNKLLDEILGYPIKNNIKEIALLKDLLPDIRDKGFQELTVGSKILAINFSPLQTTHGHKRGLVLVIQDVTEQKLTEELAIIGKFSANLAHEIRNPVTAMQGPCELIKEGVNEEEKESLLNIIINQSHRLNNIISSFLSFAKPMYPDFKIVELGSLIHSAKETVTLDYSSKLPTIEIIQKNPIYLKLDSEQIKSAFYNLILNALQILNGSGKLTIEIFTPDQKYTLFNEKRIVPFNEIVICFKDTGSGISEKIIPQIFTPFYTTKSDGVGLGLSIVSKIIENHKGKIEVKSRLNEGTIFVIHLPFISFYP